MDEAQFKRLHIAIIAGDPDAQFQFEAEVRPFALGIAIKRGLPLEDAQEVWNDAFKATLDRAATITPLGRPLRAFALSVAQRASVDRVRLRQRHQETPLEAAEVELGARALRAGESPESLPVTVVAAINRCLDAASVVHREVMTMVANRLTAREIGQLLAVTEANAAKLSQRARAWFRTCLEGVVA